MIEKLDKLNLADNQLQGRGIDMGDYKIITDTILKVTRENGHHTFNFNIKREGHTYNDTIENLIITSGRDSIYYAYLLKYNFTYNDYANDIREKIENSSVTYRPVDIDNGLILNDIFINQGELSNARVHYLCVETWVQGSGQPPTFGGQKGGLPGSNGDYDLYDTDPSWVFDTQSCSWITSGGGSIPGYGDINFPNPGWVHGHGSGAEPSPTGYPSNAYGAQALKQFGWTLSSSQLNWRNNQENGDTRDEMEAFLFQNGYTDENEAFVRAAIDALGQNPDAEIDWENKVILDFEASDCLEDIIDTLKNCSSDVFLLPEIPTNVNLSSLILNTFNNVSNHGLKIQRGNLPSNLNASTSPSSLGNNTSMYTITINNSFIQNATDLAVVRTIIHEILHAYLSYIYQDQPFSDLSSTLRHHLSANGFNDNVAQHQVMVDFVSAIGYALQNWDNNSLNGINYYKYLAWSGDLLNTPEFNSQTSAFQNNVLNANNAEGDANSSATSSAQGTDNCN